MIELIEKCVKCGRECLPTRNEENDVFVRVGDDLMCAECYQREREGRYIYEAFNGDYGEA